jgi:hypothetical protein
MHAVSVPPFSASSKTRACRQIYKGQNPYADSTRCPKQGLRESTSRYIRQFFGSGEIPNFDGAGTRALEAWLLGPKGENAEFLERLIVEAIRDQVFWRRNYHPDDPTHITEEIRRSPAYLQALDSLKESYAGLLAFLKKSVPFFSMRYQGHMNWDLTISGILEYFAAMLYNPNNVAFEGSTATTILEILVGDDLCRMLGRVCKL